MTGRTGYTSPTNGSAFEPPKDMEDIYEHFDPLIGETVDLASQLPTATAWPGREVTVQNDTDPSNNGLYIRNSDNTAWLLVGSAAVTTTGVTFGTNWSAVTGFTPYLVRRGKHVDLYGAAKLGAVGGGGGYTNILTIPVGFRPVATATRFVGTAVTDGGVAVELALTNGVLSTASGYVTGSLGFGAIVPLHCGWEMN